MENTEVLALLKQATEEIRQLRQTNNHMGARLEMFDDMMLLFRSKPEYGPSTMSEDLVWKINKFIQNSEQ